MRLYANFSLAHKRLQEDFQTLSYPVRSEKWQGLDTRPEHQMREMLFTTFEVPMNGYMDLEHWRTDIRPNVPFADVHFEERVSGVPSNPGEAWKIWPWGHAADKHRTEGEKFTHTYQERFWPKYAAEIDCANVPPNPEAPQHGIRYPYGDLNDVVDLLHREPLTRQAYFPIWFPEDTGSVHGGRVPCSLGYHFINRNGFLHVVYGIRSCDFVRHWRDDCYFTVRLAIWVLQRLRARDRRWNDVELGFFKMDITSLHMFINDYNSLFNQRAR